MTPLSCIIVDDEPLALDILEDYVRRTPSLALAGRFTGSVEALKALAAKQVDVAFLDIQMPGMNGLDMAKKVAESAFGADLRVIFTTAFPQYALEGFRVDALDYLLKPISFAEFTRSVERAVEWFAIKRAASSGTGSGASSDGSFAGSFAGSAAPAAPQTLIVKSDYKQFVVPLESIVYIEGIRDYIRIHTSDGGALQTLMNMKKVEEMLPAARFSRVHRSYIVNLDRVKKIERTHIVFDDVQIPISDTYKEGFLRALSSRSI
jgi:DNA-binding LytR/AlgR family response regulator